jgi:hypothetical protein
MALEERRLLSGGFVHDPIVADVAPTRATTTTTLTSSVNASTLGQNVTVTAVVASTTAGTPTGTVTFTVDGQAEPPVALAMVNGVDQASLTISTLPAGSHTIGATYSGDTTFASSPANPLTQSVTSSAGGTTTGAGLIIGGGSTSGTDGPRIGSVKRYGYHMRPTTIVLPFDQALDAVTAEDAKNYRIIGLGGRTIAIKKAVYDPAALTVTLYPMKRISIHHRYELIVDGTAPHGVTNTRGQLLDGNDSGSADSDYRGPLTWRNLVLDPPAGSSPARSR